jgi:REP element-mobilizing transposase RayT
MKQLAFVVKTWGGKRRNAGRPPKGPKAGVSHLRRPDLAARHPVHLTVRVAPGVGYLRAFWRARAIEGALGVAKDRLGMRIVHYSIQGVHLHLIVEAQDREALAAAMQGLGIRLARRLNALAGRRGKVLADRYHAHALRTRREVAHAVRYVTRNYHHHDRENLPREFVDPWSSARWLVAALPEDAPVAPPRTWLLRVGWIEPVSAGAAGRPGSSSDRPR